MAREIRSIDVSNMPELLRLAEEIGTSQEGMVLRRNNQDLAVIMPVPRRSTAPSKAKPVTHEDPLFGLIGIGKSGIAGGVSEKKHKYLAEAHRQRR
jgi:hypothetical protein